jgi:hypothetical protein
MRQGYPCARIRDLAHGAMRRQFLVGEREQMSQGFGR